MRLHFGIGFGLVLLVCLGAKAEQLPQLVVQGGPRHEVRVAKVSPDGRRLATLAGSLAQVWRCFAFCLV